MNKILNRYVVAGLVVFGVACLTPVNEPEKSVVLAEPQDLITNPPTPIEITNNEVVPIRVVDLPDEIESVVNKIFPGQDTIVLTTTNKLVPEASPVLPFNPTANEQGNANWLDMIMSWGSGFFSVIPGGQGGQTLAGILAFLLAFKRSRTHLVEATKSTAKLDLKNAGTSILKATGALHTEHNIKVPQTEKKPING